MKKTSVITHPSDVTLYRWRAWHCSPSISWKCRIQAISCINRRSFNACTSQPIRRRRLCCLTWDTICQYFPKSWWRKFFMWLFYMCIPNIIPIWCWWDWSEPETGCTIHGACSVVLTIPWSMVSSAQFFHICDIRNPAAPRSIDISTTSNAA